MGRKSIPPSRSLRRSQDFRRAEAENCWVFDDFVVLIGWANIAPRWTNIAPKMDRFGHPGAPGWARQATGESVLGVLFCAFFGSSC